METTVKQDRTYLGDGLYAQDDGFNINLIAPREIGDHYVCMEPDVLQQFFKFVEKARNLKITVERLG